MADAKTLTNPFFQRVFTLLLERNDLGVLKKVLKYASQHGIILSIEQWQVDRISAVPNIPLMELLVDNKVTVKNGILISLYNPILYGDFIKQVIGYSGYRIGPELIQLFNRIQYRIDFEVVAKQLVKMDPVKLRPWGSLVLTTIDALKFD